MCLIEFQIEKTEAVIIINYERNNRPEYPETEVMDKISSLKGPLNLL